MEACEALQLEQMIGLMNGTHWVSGNKLTLSHPWEKDDVFFDELKNTSAIVNQTLIECDKSVFLNQVRFALHVYMSTRKV